MSGGKARGIPLVVPKGDLVRPATDGVRQAVFSSLGGRVAGAWFWDLFAGSGAYGLEAFSRGATGGVFVERSAKALDCLQRNIAAVTRSMGVGAENLQVRPGDALALSEMGRAPDIVFVDPPYEAIPVVAPALFARLSAVLGPRTDAIVVFEYPGDLELAPAGWVQRKRLGRGARQPTVGFFVQQGSTVAGQ